MLGHHFTLQNALLIQFHKHIYYLFLVIIGVFAKLTVIE